MSKLEEYQAKAAASLAALGAASGERDRAYHGRAYGIYRKLIDNIGAAEARVQAAPAKKTR